MLERFILALICLTGGAATATASVVLVPQLSTASCDGHFSDLNITSITCGYSAKGCTYGSEVFVTGQVYASADIPRPMEVRMSKTLPNLYALGRNVYTSQVDDVCDDNFVSINNDGDDSCPYQGRYNFHFTYNNFGSSQSWYAGWHGYLMGIIVHFKHDGGGKDYATCTMNVKVEAADDGSSSYTTNASLVCIAVIGFAGLFTSLFVRKRREILEQSRQQKTDYDGTKESGAVSSFELIQDLPSVVV